MAGEPVTYSGADVDDILADKNRCIAELKAALRQIAAPTFGTEINDDDAARASVYWTHVARFQEIARKALNS